MCFFSFFVPANLGDMDDHFDPMRRQVLEETAEGAEEETRRNQSKFGTFADVTNALDLGFDLIQQQQTETEKRDRNVFKHIRTPHCLCLSCHLSLSLSVSLCLLFNALSGNSYGLSLQLCTG